MLVALTFAIGLIQAAPQTTAPPRFEVASVKLAPDQSILHARPKLTPGRFRWTTQMWYLMGYAYHMEWWRISGDKGAFGTIYEIDATVDPKATEDQVRLMLQSLLVDRFQLKFRRENKVVEGYALSLAKDGPKMQEAKDGEVPVLPDWMRNASTDPAGLEGLVIATIPEKGVGAITGRRVTMLQLTETLQRLISTAVLDQTGLTGKYYFALRYAKEADPDVPLPNLLGAVRELGLRIEKHKGPVEMLVVEHAQKAPVGN